MADGETPYTDACGNTQPMCEVTTFVNGKELCFDCGEGDGEPCLLPAASPAPICPTTSIINRPACGVIEEVECPQPDYLKHVLY